jgi:hypothetical protein
MNKAKPFCISKREVWEAYKRVKANKGAAGVDGQSIAKFEEDLKNNLYKLWNRMSSGSYFPPPVRRVEIPKDKYFVVGDALSTPFANKEFDFVIASHVAEHIDDPIKFCHELIRISKRGYIETPGPITELLLPANSHKWIVRKSGNGLIFKKNTHTTPLSSYFYSIFYLNREGYDFRTKKSQVKFLKLISWILNTSWKYIPYTYARLVWEDKFECKVK